MSSVYYNTISKEDCGICLESMERGGRVVAHQDLSKQRILHPFHKKCIKTWLKKQSKCPMCFLDVDIDSLNDPKNCKRTLKSKTIKEIKILTKDAFKGGCVALCYLLGLFVIFHELHNHSIATIPIISAVIYLYVNAVKALKGNCLTMLFPTFIFLLTVPSEHDDKKFSSFILQYEALAAVGLALASSFRRNIK